MNSRYRAHTIRSFTHLSLLHNIVINTHFTEKLKNQGGGGGAVALMTYVMDKT